jgi:hypothetical protein
MIAPPKQYHFLSATEERVRKFMKITAYPISAVESSQHRVSVVEFLRFADVARIWSVRGTQAGRQGDCRAPMAVNGHGVTKRFENVIRQRRFDGVNARLFILKTYDRIWFSSIVTGEKRVTVMEQIKFAKRHAGSICGRQP